jgi:dolichol kinase
MVVFGRIAHEGERDRINSGTWFMTALVVLALTGSTVVCVVGVTILGAADPAAGWVGRRFGRHKIAADRTFEGSLAFFVVAAATTILTLSWLPHPLERGVVLALAIVCSATAAVVETFSQRVDDNLSIPLTAAATAALVLRGFGLSVCAGR